MAEHEPFSVSYRMTPAELLRASRRVLSPLFYYYSLLRQIIAYVSLSAVIVLSFCLTNRLMFHTCEYHLWIPFALFVLVVYGDAWIIRRNLSQREARSPAFGPHRMSITADGLVDETPVTRHFYEWIGIERIEADDQFIYVIVDSPLFYMVSKRSFTSEEKEREFYLALLDHYQKARPQGD
jgi:hypothetical protein